MNQYDEVIDFAIAEELKSVVFYQKLSARADTAYMRNVFLDMAEEELKHKKKLEDLKLLDNDVLFSGKIEYFNISDYVAKVDPETAKDIGYKESLIIAIKGEEYSLKMYLELAKLAETARIKNLFLVLAEEEGAHKRRCEIEYAENKKAQFI